MRRRIYLSHPMVKVSFLIHKNLTFKTPVFFKNKSYSNPVHRCEIAKNAVHNNDGDDSSWLVHQVTSGDQRQTCGSTPYQLGTAQFRLKTFLLLSFIFN